MNTSIRRVLVTLSLSAALGPIGLMAQNPMHVTVPFDFTVGSKSFAAGVYTVHNGVAPSVVAIKSADGRSSIMTLTNGVQARQAPGKGKLIFNRYGESYFLSQIWAAGNEVGRQLPRTSAEKELIAKATSPTPVTLTASNQE